MKRQAVDVRGSAVSGGSSKPKLAARGVYVAKGGVDILDGIDLKVAPGSFVALVGPSGAGKFTLLQALAGLETLDAGLIEKDGPPLARPGLVAYMPQSDLLLPWRNVLANVSSLGLEATGTPKRPARQRALAALKRFGLEEFAQLPPAALSGGMRSRGALLRTALLGRDVLLLDEPFGALDALTRRVLQEWLLGVRDDLAATIVLVARLPEVGVPNYDELVFATNDDYARENPDLVRRFVGALVEGHEYALNNPEAARDALLAANEQLDPEVVDEMLRLTVPIFEDGSGWATRTRRSGAPTWTGPSRTACSRSRSAWTR